MSDFEPLSLEQVQRWLVAARPGAELVYGAGVTCRPGPAVAGACAPEVADWLLEQAAKGFVALVQRRNGPPGTVPAFHYIAQRCEKRWDPEAPGKQGPRLNVVRRHPGSAEIDSILAQIDRAFA